MTTELEDSPTLTEAAISISGMNCASCVSHVSKAARSLPGVAVCDVNLARGRAEVRFDPAQTSPDKIAAVITESGYPAQTQLPGADAGQAEEERLQRQIRHADQWRRRAIVGFVLWFPVEAAHWILKLFLPEAHAPHMDLEWIALLTSTAAMLYIGSSFYKSAWTAVLHRTSNMDTLISLGASVAYLYSLIFFVGGLLGAWAMPVGDELYFMESTALLALISLGHWLEARARQSAGSAIRQLLQLTPNTALRMSDNAAEPTELPVTDLQVGDRVLVRPGDRMPIDGVVVDGASSVDESMITGEALLVTRKIGDKVIGGTINQDGRLVVRATKVGAESALGQIVQLVERAQSSKPPVQRLADQISAVFVPSVLAIALTTAIGWYAWGSIHHWTGAAKWAAIAKATCSVLLIACPCALGLAVPAALMVGTGRGARRGILIRDIDSLQSAEKIDTIVLDKTGTVTTGKPVVAGITTNDGVTEDQVLRLAAAAEQFSAHPLAKAIVAAARDRKLTLPQPTRFNTEPGYGVIAEVEGRSLLMGGRALLERHASEGFQGSGPEEGQTHVYVAEKKPDGIHLLGLISLNDQPKSDSAAAIARLHQLNLGTMLLTGDNFRSGERIAKLVGIREVQADVKPGEKADAIQKLRTAGHRVAMVGDGINDAPALAEADLGIALGSGSDVAKETGGIVLVGQSLHGVVSAILLSRTTMRKIRQNLFLAFIYNVLAIPLAAFGLLTPLMAAGAMALSDVCVIGNALLLRKSKID